MYCHHLQLVGLVTIYCIILLCLLIFIVASTVFRFDLYFRKNPFAGEFTIFGGLEECVRFIANFKLKEEEIRFLRAALPTCEVGIPML